jgi:hypothetical protein
MKRLINWSVIGAFVVIVLRSGTAEASLITFSGSDAGANSNSARVSSDAAAASFDAAAALLGLPSLITFESAPVGSFSNLTVAPGVILKSDSSFLSQILDSSLFFPDAVFGYNTTPGGTHFVDAEGGTLTFNFSTPVQAFGAYISGIQNSGEMIAFFDGSPQSVPIPFVGLSGGIAFVGFTDANESISSLVLNFQFGSIGDVVGIDDVRYVAAGPEPVPEPASLLLLGTGLTAVLRRHYRRELP